MKTKIHGHQREHAGYQVACSNVLKRKHEIQSRNTQCFDDLIPTLLTGKELDDIRNII
uniref:hypothetical protein n=1 Tax=Candidatus Methanarcanum hacksteinii TaxID=2911857 RepID=UPI0037DCBB87